MLGDKFLQKKYRQKKPKLLTVSLLSLLESYESMLRTLKVLNSGERIVAVDIDASKGIDETSLNLKIYTNKEVQSRTRKD